VKFTLHQGRAHRDKVMGERRADACFVRESTLDVIADTAVPTNRL
jgi:hypothetical protein